MSNFTQNAIRQTFTEMLEDVPFDKITVTALTKACHISHNTFYYHYKDIYELLDIWLNEELGNYVWEEWEGGWEENTKALLHRCKDNAKIVYHIFNSLSRDHMERYVFSLTNDVFFQYVCRKAEGKNIPEERLRDISDFCRYAFVGFVLRFFWNNMEDDIDTGVEKLSGLFLGFVTQAIESSSGH
ncbi:MAG: TetR/AcrR family transcriptional regulator C-terminal domain-containing protein [Lachnospiraceae bacterium]|nr:TetR/AcrR family transcriptional regulator C-terminal domain-containing protein [Lachnospiraceae bacterium]